MGTQSAKKQELAQTLLSHGTKLKVDPVTIIYTNIPTSTEENIIVSVPKKSCKSAVKRNKIRRQLKSLVRVNAKASLYTTAWMFIVKTEALSSETLKSITSVIENLNAQKTC